MDIKLNRFSNVSGFIRGGFSLLLFILVFSIDAFAAEGFTIDGASLSLWWTLPFVGILLSIAIFPLVAPDFWHHQFGKVSAFWAFLLLIPMIVSFGWQITLHETLHAYLLEYIPFIILLFALFTISGGVRITGYLKGSPEVNTIMLLIGTILASWMGTTGAAMLMIRPMIRANEWRTHKVHMVVFFIFLVANVGGSLTPLGDPPLFLGFLQGVNFFWTTTHMFLPMLFVVVILLAIFYVWDKMLYNKDTNKEPEDTGEAFGLEGSFNLLLLAGVVGAVLFSGFVKLGHIDIYHIPVQIENIIRDVSMLILSWISWHFTSKQSRAANGFTWFPIEEVGKLFAGIFITIIAPIAMLKAGKEGEGALKFVNDMVFDPSGDPNNSMFFWITGMLSAFLDNAPTYLVFFNAAGGDASVLMTTLADTLLAVSAGAVFFGAMTYIGNAPNFMVKSIAESADIKMPSFGGYMLWSFGILAPIYILVTFLFIV